MQSIIKGFKIALITGLEREFLESLRVLSRNEQIKFLDGLKYENLDLLFLKLIQKYSGLLSGSSFSYTDILNREYKIEFGYQLIQENALSQIAKTIDVEFLLLKGTALNYYLNSDLYKRRLDIDILITKENIKLFSIGLENLGYKKTPKYYAHGEISFEKSPNLFIDLHYDISVSSGLMRCFKIDSRGLFNDKIDMISGDLQYETLSLEWTLIYLCLHFVINHQINQFILLYEICELTKKRLSDIDISKLRELLFKTKTDKVFYFVYKIILTINNNTEFNKLFNQINLNVDMVNRLNKYLQEEDIVERLFANSNKLNSKVWLVSFDDKLNYYLGCSLFYAKGLFLKLNNKVN
jgi:hypothetical protein